MSSTTSAQSVAPFTITTAREPGGFALESFQGEEAISALFHYHLELEAQSSSVNDSRIIGSEFALAMEQPEGRERQYVNGMIARISQCGTATRSTTYLADAYPWLWLLTLNSGYRIFQNKTVAEIVQQIFHDRGCRDFRNVLTKTYKPREFCVQYGETDFNFVSRLLESEGIFYFFGYTEEKHTPVLADDPSACPTLPGNHIVQANAPEGQYEFVDAMLECSFQQQMVPEQYRSSDFNFLTPATRLLATAGHSDAPHSIYEYPGDYPSLSDGESLAGLRLDALKSPAKILTGTSLCRAFHAGYKFKLEGHHRPDINGEYVLTRVRHQGSQEEYSNWFEAIPADVPFRPARVTPVPRIYGSQTAIVVGKEGEEIWTDQYGRVKVKFHWDRDPQRNEHSSCWIRVAHGSAGKGWGSMFVPRVGQEVVVTFLDGDPDRPLITGCVYNSYQVVPYDLPEEQTKSTIKSHSCKEGNGFNEIRFEDKKGSEEVFLHAQKDMNVTVLDSLATTVKHNRSTTVQEENDSLVIEKGNRSIKVNQGNESHAVQGTRSVEVTGNESHTNHADFTQNVTGNYTLKISGNLNIEVEGAISIKSGMSLETKAGTSLTNQAGTSLTNKAGTTMSNEANISITSKANASQEVESSGMLTLKGSLVKIN